MSQTAQAWDRITQQRGRERQLPWYRTFSSGFTLTEPGPVGHKGGK
jgi:hypothetical protein